MQSLSLTRSALLLALCVGAGCNPDTPTSSDSTGLEALRTGGTDPTVKATDPDTALRNVTLDVRVLGSGYDQGSRAIWALNGDTALATTKVKTNSTKYVSSKELVANITIAADAVEDLYDVVVLTARGKKGIGIELFAVTGVSSTLVGPTREQSVAQGINDGGQVVGYIGTVNMTPRRAFLWTPTIPRGLTGSRIELGTLGGAESHAKDVNNAGHVVGGSFNAAGTWQPFLWTPGRGMQNLGGLVDGLQAGAMAINEVGQVAGYAVTAEGQFATLWTVSVDASGTAQVLSRENLGTLPLGGSSVAFGLNQRGQVTGYAYASASGPNRPVLWTRTADAWVIEDLGLAVSDFHGTASAVNDNGMAVGYSRPQQGCPNAIVWTTVNGKRTGMTVLGTLGGCGAEAYGVNNAGQVIGRSVNRQGQTRATVWTVSADGAMLSIKDLGVLYGNVRSAGWGMSSQIGGVVQVAGTSETGSGQDRATLWNVAP